MAIDSRDKRFSLLTYDGLGGRIYPVPDGAVSTADRIQWIGKYRGIAFPAPAGGGLNTASKRFAMMTYDWVIGRVLPSPDGAFSTADRIHLIGKYPGIAFTSISPVVSVFIPVIRRRRR